MKKTLIITTFFLIFALYFVILNSLQNKQKPYEIQQKESSQEVKKEITDEIVQEVSTNTAPKVTQITKKHIETKTQEPIKELEQPQEVKQQVEETPEIKESPNEVLKWNFQVTNQKSFNSKNCKYPFDCNSYKAIVDLTRKSYAVVSPVECKLQDRVGDKKFTYTMTQTEDFIFIHHADDYKDRETYIQCKAFYNEDGKTIWQISDWYFVETNNQS